MSTEAAAEAMAARMVAYVARHARRNIHFQVLAPSKVEHFPTKPFYRKTYNEPPFPSMWQHRGLRGVSYHRKQTEQAAAWVTAALRAGYTVFWNTRKRGCCNGRSLQQGPADYWDEEPMSSQRGRV